MKRLCDAPIERAGLAVRLPLIGAIIALLTRNAPREMQALMGWIKRAAEQR